MSTIPTPKRGDIWLVDFEPAVGAEIKKTRPAVVVTALGVGRLPLEIVVPLTEWKADYADATWFVRIPATRTTGLSKESGADAFQVKSLSRRRFVRRIGVVSAPELEAIIRAVAVSVGARSFGS